MQSIRTSVTVIDCVQSSPVDSAVRPHAQGEASNNQQAPLFLDLFPLEEDVTGTTAEPWPVLH